MTKLLILDYQIVKKVSNTRLESYLLVFDFRKQIIKDELAV
jgi:hypothetical protein